MGRGLLSPVSILLFMLSVLFVLLAFRGDQALISKEADSLLEKQKYEEAKNKYQFILRQTKETKYLKNANLKLSRIYYHYAVTAYNNSQYKSSLDNVALALKYNQLNGRAKHLGRLVGNRKKLLIEAKVELEGSYSLFLESAKNIESATRLLDDSETASALIYFIKARNNLFRARQQLGQNKIPLEETKEVNPLPLFNSFIAKLVNYLDVVAISEYDAKSGKLSGEIIELGRKTRIAYLGFTKRVDEICNK